jgi:hypothetical protein
MSENDMINSSGKSYNKEFVLLICTLLLLFVCGEIFFRVYYWVSDKTIASAERHQASVLDDLKGQQQELTSKMKSRESVSNYMDEVTKGTKDKTGANVGTRDDLNIKSQLNTDKSLATKIDRSDKATQEKGTYAEKVRAERTTSKGTSIGGK